MEQQSDQVDGARNANFASQVTHAIHAYAHIHTHAQQTNAYVLCMVRAQQKLRRHVHINADPANCPPPFTLFKPRAADSKQDCETNDCVENQNLFGAQLSRLVWHFYSIWADSKTRKQMKKPRPQPGKRKCCYRLCGACVSTSPLDAARAMPFIKDLRNMPGARPELIVPPSTLMPAHFCSIAAAQRAWRERSRARRKARIWILLWVDPCVITPERSLDSQPERSQRGHV